MRDKKPKGLGGWLILWHIGLIFSLISSTYVMGLYSLSVIFALLGLTLFLLSIFTIVAFYSKHKAFPPFAKILLWLSFFTLMLMYIMARSSENYVNYVNLFLTFIINLVWHIYLNKSERVKNTFIK